MQTLHPCSKNSDTALTNLILGYHERIFWNSKLPKGCWSHHCWKLIPIRISRIAMSSQEYNQSINVITQYYILHKIIFTNVNYITISWLNTLRRRPCSRNLGCRGGKRRYSICKAKARMKKLSSGEFRFILLPTQCLYLLQVRDFYYFPVI